MGLRAGSELSSSIEPRTSTLETSEIMAKPFQKWTVNPHGSIEKVHANLWRVQAPFPGAPFPRTMILARLADGRIVVHNAIALDDGEMKEIEAWGIPAVLIVPSGGHRMDAKI